MERYSCFLKIFFLLILAAALAILFCIGYHLYKDGMPYRYDEYPPYGLPINLWERRQNILMRGHEIA